MELRVWVDGTQRVVCGVKLTTTCQEIVFALAHATQQAGRFTMIERWRNNERLLSPNEQPLVTLQRWGDRMNEVEFILRKTSTDPLPPVQQQPTTNNIQAHQQQSTANSMPSQHLSSRQQATAIARSNTPTGSIISKQPSQQLDQDPIHRQKTITNGHISHESPIPSHVPATVAHQAQKLLSDQAQDSLYQQQRQLNLSRRPQTSLGPLTSSGSALNITSNNLSQQPLNRLTSAFRPSLSASVLPNPTNNGTVMQSVPILRSRYVDDKPRSPSLYNGNNNHHNSYQLQNETMCYQQANTNHLSKNYPYDDLYSTINKKRTIHPPAVPAKPRLSGSMSQQQSMNNAQMNYYPGQSPVHMYPVNLRPRHPPGYLEYLDAMANRNSLPASLVSNPNFIYQSQTVQGNMFPRSSYDLPNEQFYNINQAPHQNRMSPVNSSNGNQYYYQANRPVNRMSFSLGNDTNQDPTGMQNQMNQINPKLIESGLVINRGSAVNIKLPPNSQYVGQNQSSIEEQKLDSSLQSNASSVSQMGMDMLKVIEEQKKVLLNQKNELDRLDHDREYFEAKQNSEQAELINRIEKEIAQLETLWRENQRQIKKLENQDFEKELEELKAEQTRMERDIVSQKSKLATFEKDIAQCMSKIEQLENELTTIDSDFDNDDDGLTTEADQESDCEKAGSKNSTFKALSDSDSLDLRSRKLVLRPNGSGGFLNNHLIHSSDDDDSGGNASDDLNLGVNSNGGVSSKLRSAKDVAYVDKRGLISGLRSLKLDKTRAQNRSNEKINSSDNPISKLSSNSPTANHLIHKDRSPDSTNNSSKAESTTSASRENQQSNAFEKNGQDEKSTTASNINNNTDNKYEFLMTL